MHRFLLAATVGLGLLAAAGSVSAAFARPGPEHGAPIHGAAPTRATPANYDHYRPHATPRYQHHGYQSHWNRPHWNQPHWNRPHWNRPAPHRYQQSYHHPRPGDRRDAHRGDNRGWR